MSRIETGNTLSNQEIIDLIDKDTWLSSDHHFGHERLLVFEPSRETRAKELGFKDWEEMVIEQHNALVKPDDTVLLLGDYAWKGIQKYRNVLNGNKIMILGNHDRKGTQVYGNINIVRGLLIDYNGHTLELPKPDGLFSGIMKNFGEDQIMFSHYALLNDDEYDHQNEKIRPRMDILEEFYESFDCNINVHGHLHSKDSSYEGARSACLERTDFKPVQLKNLI